MTPETSVSRAAAPVEARLEAGGVPAARIRALERALAAAGVRLCPDARNAIVVLDPCRPGAAATVGTLARRGRLLVLSQSGAPDWDTGWAMLRSGASDVLAWTGDEVAAAAAQRLRRWRVVDQLLDRPSVREFLVGDSKPWRSVLREAVEVARFTAAAVLITGESGTGKERVAQLIHDLDPRPAKKKLVILDCSTVVASLSGSEFFGHEKGAFTGASVARAGAFELADGGTLFLDEVGELPVTLQAELLRVVQEGTYKRVGSNAWRRSAFRLICATNRDLAAGQADGAIRGDFFHRISGCTLHLPALRDRSDDIIPLVKHFFRQARPDRETPALAPAVRDLLVRRPYPGNVRELRGLALRIVHRHLGDSEISIGDVPEQERPAPEAAGTADRPLEDWVRTRLARGDTLAQITAEVREEVVRLGMFSRDADPRRAARALAVPESAPSGDGAAVPAG